MMFLAYNVNIVYQSFFIFPKRNRTVAVPKKQLLQLILQDACAYKILQDGRFGKIEQEHLARSFKYMQDPSYAR